MATANPYAAPKAAVEDVQSGEPELATRWQRFVAAFVDGLVVGLAVMAAMLAVGAGSASGNPKAALIVAYAIALGGVGAINLWMLHRYRASIGKRTQKIRMVRSDGSEAELWRLVFLRGLPQWIVSLLGNVLAFVGLLSLVDVLFIFGKSRRCVHDLIADTIVVRTE